MLLLTACGHPPTAPTVRPPPPAAPSAPTASAPSAAATARPAPPGGLTDAPDACNFVGEVALGPVGKDGLTDVPPNHPYLRYVGRFDCSDPAGPTFAYPAVALHARFTGDALDLRLADHGRGGTSTNYFDVSLDGQPTFRLEVTPSREVYELARGLPPGEHTVAIVKRTESAPGGKSNSGKGEVLGLRLRDGATLLPVISPPRRLEVIGDSITCGYGNELSTTDPGSAHYTSRNSNANLSFGALAARALDAEYVAVAYSGRGISRNYAGGAGPTLPQLYLRTLPDEQTGAPWDVTRLVPDVVVINLGTNDFSTPGVDRAAFRARYTEFLAALRGYYPRAPFVATVGPMLTDAYPPGAQALTNAQADVKEVVQARHAAGDSRVYFFAFTPQTSPFGEDWHPTVATHQRMAAELVPFLRDLF